MEISHSPNKPTTVVAQARIIKKSPLGIVSYLHMLRYKIWDGRYRID